jgi:hypothetical protein
MSSWSPANSSGWTGLTSHSLSGALSVASSVVSAVSSSVPAQWVSSGVKAYIPGHDSTRPGGAGGAGGGGGSGGRDRVLWAGFDADDGAPSQPQFLCVCFANGFQIWRARPLPPIPSPLTLLNSPRQPSQMTEAPICAARRGHPRSPPTPHPPWSPSGHPAEGVLLPRGRFNGAMIRPQQAARAS